MHLVYGIINADPFNEKSPVIVIVADAKSQKGVSEDASYFSFFMLGKLFPFCPSYC